MKRSILAILIAVGLLGSGCASIVSRTSREVNLRTTPDGASIAIVDRKNKTIFKGETPTIVTLKTGRPYGTQKYTVTFTKEGYADQTFTVKSTLNGWYFGNLVFGGLVGILIVDPLTGAMWSLSPKEINATLVAKAVASVEPGQPALQIVELDQVPIDLRAKMVRLN